VTGSPTGRPVRQIRSPSYVAGVGTPSMLTATSVPLCSSRKQRSAVLVKRTSVREV
jgi:hypothetical protein